MLVSVGRLSLGTDTANPSPLITRPSPGFFTPVVPVAHSPIAGLSQHGTLVAWVADCGAWDAGPMQIIEGMPALLLTPSLFFSTKKLCPINLSSPHPLYFLSQKSFFTSQTSFVILFLLTKSVYHTTH